MPACTTRRTRSSSQTLHALEHNRWLSATLGRNGRQFFREHYDWPVVERKYLDMFARLSAEPPGRALDPLPGWLARRRQNLPPAEEVLATLPEGPSLSDYRDRAAEPEAGRPPISASEPEISPFAPADNRDRASGGGFAPFTAPPRVQPPTSRQRSLPMIQIHQVLATLGYGDAIGHEVLGIQRVLRGQGYASEIFVETADYRLEPLTRDYRELVDFSHPDNLLLHHFSLGSKASRTAFALPDRMALIYHNITPPEYFIGVHRMLARQCFRGRRELRAYADRCDLALGDSEFNRQDLENLGFPRTAVLPVDSRLLQSRPASESGDGRPVRRRVDQCRVRRPGDCEQEDRGSDPLFSRVPHDVQPAVPPAGGRRVQRLRTVPGVAAPAGGNARRASRALSRPRVRRGARRLLRRRRFVPVRKRARGILRTACRSLLQTDPGPRLRGDGRSGHDGRRRRPLRRQGPEVGGVADGRDRVERATCRTRSFRSSWRRSAVSRTKTSQARSSASSTTSSLRRARRSRGWPSISGNSSTPRRSSKQLRLYRPAIYKALPEERPRALVYDCEPVGACRPSWRRHRRQRQTGARSAADAGTSVRAVRVDDRRRSRGGRASVRRSGRAPRRSHHLPLRAAVADDLGVRRLAARTRPPISQRDAGGILCALRPGTVPPGGARAPGAVDAGRIRRPRARRFRIQPQGARDPRVLADRRVSHRRRHVAHHPSRRAARARRDSRRWAGEFSVRWSNRAEQEDRGSHSTGRMLQALRGRVLSLHLRRPLRRGATVLFDDSRAHDGVPPARTIASSSRAPFPTRSSPSTIATRRSTSR